MYSIIGKTLYEISPCKEIENPIAYFKSKSKAKGNYIAVLFEDDKIDPLSFKNSLKNITTSIINDDSIKYRKIGKIVDIKCTIQYDFAITNKEKNVEFNHLYYYFVLDTNKFMIIYNSMAYTLLNTNCVLFFEDIFSCNDYYFGLNTTTVDYTTFDINLTQVNAVGHCLYNIEDRKMFAFANKIFNPANKYNFDNVMYLTHAHIDKTYEKDIKKCINKKNKEIVKERLKYILF